MIKNTLLAILIIPVCLGGVFMWATSAKSTRDKRIIAANVIYDVLIFCRVSSLAEGFLSRSTENGELTTENYRWSN
jgi:hypothetical protein